jgi:NADPH:quinone reductase-like Zn-dependent oxidoreductase
VAAAGSSGIQAAANAARGGEADALRAIADGGRLATITGGPPPTERDIAIASVYVRPDGDMLRRLAALLAEGRLSVGVGASYPLSRAAEALARAMNAAGGAGVVLEP